MRIVQIRTLGLVMCFGLLLMIPLLANAQNTPANSVVGYPGAGVLQVGDYWDSFLPESFGPFYSEAADAGTRGRRQFIRFGNFDRSWTTPNGHWPAAFPFTMYWSHYMHAIEYNPDTTFNPAKIGGVDNPSVYANSLGATSGYSNYGYIATKPTVNGWTDAARQYSVEPYWVDGDRRQHAVYEAAFPTNLGIDVKIRAHAFTGPNWNNLNDFIILEIQMKNTGFLDMNMDGTAEKTNNAIRALCLNMAGEIFMSVGSQPGGGRNVNAITLKWNRMGGWIGDPDPDGFPWAFSTYYPGANSQVPIPGKNDVGFNAGTNKSYTDTWDGWVWIGAKRGGLPSDASRSTANLPTRNLIFGVDPVGIGPERGNYISAGSGGGLAATFSAPQRMHSVSAGTFFQNGGISRSIADLSLNLNPAFFQSGTSGNITSFVKKATPAPPNGDQKTLNTFDQTPSEDGKANATTNYPNGWGKWTKGYNFAHDFNGDLYSGIGPLSIEKDSTITVVLGLVAGYRLEGIQKSVRAARWAYANDFQLPALPKLPDMKATNTLNKTVAVEWDNKADGDLGFAGYKIWKSSNAKKRNWLDDGLRLADRYQEQMSPTEDIAPLKKPVNPKFDAFSDVSASSLKGQYQPDTWGTWDLVKTVTKAELASLPRATSPGYTYLYEDKDVVLGFSYWYYVSAYKEGTYTGPGGETTTRIETHSTNRNGASGLWLKTFPFATANPNYPSTVAGQKSIGAVQRVFSALAPSGDVANVGVRPNPYKRAAFHDNFTNVFDHKLLFYNLPPSCTITILDVAGLIIDEIKFSSSDPNNGSTFWDMFSKDGIEVTSGLYIYVAESPSGGQKTGYFSILR